MIPQKVREASLPEMREAIRKLKDEQKLLFF